MTLSEALKKHPDFRHFIIEDDYHCLARDNLYSSIYLVFERGKKSKMFDFSKPAYWCTSRIEAFEWVKAKLKRKHN